MLPEVRVSMPLATAAPAATPPPRPLLKKAAAALRVLFRLGADAVLYGFLAALSAYCLGSVVYVLGRWICGEGSAVEGAGGAIRESAAGVMMPLFLAFFPLFVVRAFEYAKFTAEEKDKKQCPERDGLPRLRKVTAITAYVGSLALSALSLLATQMKLNAEKGSLVWKLGSVLFDIALLAYPFLSGFVMISNMVILMLISRVKDEDDVML